MYEEDFIATKIIGTVVLLAIGVWLYLLSSARTKGEFLNKLIASL
jgi:hypothetical protein